MDTNTTPSTVHWTDYPVPVLELVAQVINTWIAGDVLSDEQDLLTESGRIKIAKRLLLANIRRDVMQAIEKNKTNGPVQQPRSG